MKLEADEPLLESQSQSQSQAQSRSLSPQVAGPRRRRFPDLEALRERAEEMFAPPRRRRLTWGGALSAVGVSIAMAAYSLLRVGGAGAFNSVWAEDGSNFLSDAYLLPARETIFKPINGYFVVLPRVIGEVASQFPLLWGPAVLSTCAALYSSAMAVMVYVASATTLRRPFLRAVAAFAIVAAPLAESTLTFGPNMVAPLQFVELYGLFWVLVWTPSRNLAKAVAITFVVLSGLSTFLAVLLLPLALFRLWALRNRWSMLLLTLIVLGGLFQTTGLALGLTSRSGISHPRLDPLWALRSYVDWALPFGLVGEKPMSDAGFAAPGVHTGGGGPLYWSGVLATWLVIAAVIVVAYRRLTRPYWLFAAVAAGQSAWLLCGQIIFQGKLELRYAYTPSLIAVAGLLALLCPVRVSRHSLRVAWAGSWLPAVVLVGLLAAGAGVNYRVASPRTAAVPWNVQVEQSRRQCQANPLLPFVITVSVDAWFVIVPCERLLS
jgi:hypothetical protein